MKKILKNLAWYPPAESMIPWPVLLGSLLQSSDYFKEQLCNYLQVEHCILGNSGRSLLYLLLDKLKKRHHGARDEVLIPGYTCYSVTASVVKAGLKIKVYDLNPATLQPDFDSLRNSISDKTLAIIFQHLFGIPAPIHDMKETAENTGAYLIEDAAQSLGGTLNGQTLGTIGDFGFYSFGRGKPLPLGSGGALVGKDADVLSGLDLKPRNKGYPSLMSTAVTQVMSKPAFYWIPEMLPLGLGETHFDPDFNISGMPLIIQKLAEHFVSILDDLNAHRHDIANIYKRAFSSDSVIPIATEGSPFYTRFPIMAGPVPIPKELKRLGVRRMYPQAIADVDTIKPYLVDNEASTPGATEIAQDLITLPTHKGITENVAKEIARNVMIAYGT